MWACVRAGIGAACVLLATAAAKAQEERTLQSGPFKRSYTLLGEEPGRPKPLILALHGNTGSGLQFMRNGEWARLVVGGEMVIAFPDGLNRGWADGRPDSEFRGRRPPASTDDVAFLVQLVGELVKQEIAERRRIYVAGISNGGMMALRLICDRPDLFAAAAVVVASMPESTAPRCRPSRPIPVMIMNGTQDTLVPDQPTPGQFLGTEGTAAFWRRINRCPAPARQVEFPDLDPTDGSRVTVSITRCPQGADVAVYRAIGGGHKMPSRVSARQGDRLLGPRNRDIEGSAVIWDFLRQHAR